jgi:hypothetical protein
MCNKALFIYYTSPSNLTMLWKVSFIESVVRGSVRVKVGSFIGLERISTFTDATLGVSESY